MQQRVVITECDVDGCEETTAIRNDRVGRSGDATAGHAVTYAPSTTGCYASCSDPRQAHARRHPD